MKQRSVQIVGRQVCANYTQPCPHYHRHKVNSRSVSQTELTPFLLRILLEALELLFLAPLEWGIRGGTDNPLAYRHLYLQMTRAAIEPALQIADSAGVSTVLRWISTVSYDWQINISRSAFRAFAMRESVPRRGTSRTFTLRLGHTYSRPLRQLLQHQTQPLAQPAHSLAYNLCKAGRRTRHRIL